MTNYQNYGYDFPDLPTEAKKLNSEFDVDFNGGDLEKYSAREARTTDLSQFSLEITEEANIPKGWGTRRIKGKLIWYGNRKLVPRGDEPAWKVSMAFGVCLGYSNLLKIWIGDDLVHRHIPSAKSSYLGGYPDFEAETTPPETPEDETGVIDIQPPELAGGDGGDSQTENFLYKPFQEVRWYPGSFTQNPDTTINIFEDRAPTWRGLAYCVFEDFYLESEDSIPDVTFEIYNGCYDENPAEIIEDILTNDFYGLGLSSSLLNVASFSSVESFCDTNDLLISPILEKDTSALDFIKYILSHHLGFLYDKQGVIYLKQFRSESVTKAYEKNDLLTSKKPLKKKRINSGYNKIEVKFPKRTSYYSEEIAPLTFDYIPYSETKELKIELEYTKGYRAMMLARAFCETQIDKSVEYSFTLPFRETQNISVGDVITLTIADYNLDTVKMRVKKLSLNKNLALNVKATLEKEINLKEITHATQQYQSYHMSGYPGLCREIQLQLDNDGTNDIIKLHYASGNRPNWLGCAVYRAYDDEHYALLKKNHKRTLRAQIDSLSLDGTDWELDFHLIEENQTIEENTENITTVIQAESIKNLCWMNMAVLDTPSYNKVNVGIYFRYKSITDNGDGTYTAIVDDNNKNLASHPYFTSDFDASDFTDKIFTLLEEGELPFEDAVPTSYTGDIYYKFCSYNIRGQEILLSDVTAKTITFT